MRTRLRTYVTVAVVVVGRRRRSCTYAARPMAMMRYDIRTRTVEVIAVSIAAVDAEVPVIVRPANRAEEIVRSHVAVVLPTIEHMAKAAVTQ